MAVQDALARGRAAFDRESWTDAYARFVEADRNTPLDPADLDALATAAYLIGEDTASLDAWTRAHTGHLAHEDIKRAALSALWLAFVLLDEPGQQAAASGWLARVARLLENCPPECAARGRWLCATAFASIRQGDVAAAARGFEEAARMGRACGDADLAALARQGHGRVLLRQERTREGLAALDEAMVAVTCGEVGPIVAGIVYCSVIGACHEVFELRRAHEWTTALAGWCAAHPDMVMFRGTCLVRRSELLQLRGYWHESVEEARRACERTARGAAKREAGLAQYRLGDLRRLRGEFEAAEAAYRLANLAGRKPDPGLALLRMATGDIPAAVTAIQRALEEMRSPRARVDGQRAAVEILLAAGDTAGAADVAAELRTAADRVGASFLGAAAETATAAVALARGELDLAFASLRAATATWEQIDAPNHAIVKGCRRHEPAMDFLSANEAELEGICDPDVLALAAEQNRSLVTHDRQTMLWHFAEFLVSGRTCPGVFLVSQACTDWQGNRCIRTHLGGIGSRRMEEPHRKRSGTLKSRCIWQFRCRSRPRPYVKDRPNGFRKSRGHSMKQCQKERTPS